jgi:hypothetical protein
MKNVVLIICAWSIFHVESMVAQVVTKDEHRLNAAASIVAPDLKKHLEVLASDAYEGRETGMPGQKKAAQYLVDYYKNLGIAPGNNGSYLQTFPLKKQSYVKSTFAVNDKTFNYVKDFFTWGAEWTELMGEEIIFVGYGIDHPLYSDLKGLNLQDKVVLCLSGEPKTSDGKNVITGNMSPSDWGVDIEKKQEALKALGAKGVVVIEPGYEVLIQRIRYWLEQPGMDLDYPTKRDNAEIVLPTVYVSREIGNALLSKGRSNVEKEIARIHSKVRRKN